MIPSFGSINLLEQLTELWKTFDLLDHWCMIKGCNSRTARRKRFIARHGVPQPGSSLNPVFLDFYGGFISQTQMIKSVAMGD